MMITDYGYCNYVKKLQYSKYIVHQLKDIVTLRPQCIVLRCILCMHLKTLDTEMHNLRSIVSKCILCTHVETIDIAMRNLRCIVSTYILCIHFKTMNINMYSLRSTISMRCNYHSLSIFY